jgi:hypothetical protein
MPTYTCRRTATPITTDGMLNEEAWDAAEAAELQLYDGSGKPQMPTIAKLCYDDQCLYVAFQCADTEIQATFTKRDDPIFCEEVVEIFIDPDSCQLGYCEFELSPRNVVFDASVENPIDSRVELDVSWDCPGLKTAVHMTESGDWTAEMAIPFSSLDTAPHNPPIPGDEWRINLYRIKRIPKTEYTCWSPTLATPVDFHTPSKFGTLRFE